MTCFDGLNMKTESILAVLTLINMVNSFLADLSMKKCLNIVLIIQT